jgi:hypothetical protein
VARVPIKKQAAIIANIIRRNRAARANPDAKVASRAGRVKSRFTSSYKNMRIAPAHHGWRWMAAGWQLYRLSPGLWTLLVFTWWVLIAVLNQFPYVGPVAATVVLPAFMMGFMSMCEELRHGRPLRPALLFAGFKQRLWPLLALGALYLVSILAVLWASSFVDGGVLLNWVMWAKAPPEAALTDGSLSKALLVAGLLGTPVFAAFWFAPLLVSWDGMGPAKALFYSFFGCLRNWRPFMVYGIAITLAGIAFSVVVTLVALLARGNPAALRGLVLAATLVMLPTLFASFYVAYRDIFPEPDARPGTAVDAPA